MKMLKYVSLIWLIVSISSAVSNWGWEITKNPIFVSIMLFVSAACFAVGDSWED